MSTLISTEAIDGSHIRKEWHQDEWYVLKNRLKREGNESLREIKQLKLTAADGKRYLTDCLNTEQILRLIQSIPSPKVEPMKMWLAQVVKERLDESGDPEFGLFRSFDRTIER